MVLPQARCLTACGSHELAELFREPIGFRSVLQASFFRKLGLECKNVFGQRIDEAL